MTPAENERARHIDSAEKRHRCVLIDPNRIRCLDCEQTVVIPAQPAPAPVAVAPSTSSTSHTPLPLRHPDACRLHVGQLARNCSPCRSEQWG